MDLSDYEKEPVTKRRRIFTGLNLSNWNLLSSFYKSEETEDEDTIPFLKSEYETICDNSKLNLKNFASSYLQNFNNRMDEKQLLENSDKLFKPTLIHQRSYSLTNSSEFRTSTSVTQLSNEELIEK